MTSELYGHRHLATYDSSSATCLRLFEGQLGLRWMHSAIISDLLAETMAGRYRSSYAIYRHVRHDIGYLSNELIENAIKFRSPGDVLIEASFDHHQFRMKVVNSIDTDTSQRFKRLIEKLTSADPSDLLIQQLERNANIADESASGLGLLTLMSDYQADLAWLFEDDDASRSVSLTTYAAITVTSANNS